VLNSYILMVSAVEISKQYLQTAVAKNELMTNISSYLNVMIDN